MSKQIHAIEFSGIWNLHDGEFYEANNILDADSVGEEQAKDNAERLALLWNAMLGLTNEQVEGMRDEIKTLMYLCEENGKPVDGFRFREIIQNLKQYIKP